LISYLAEQLIEKLENEAKTKNSDQLKRLGVVLF